MGYILVLNYYFSSLEFKVRRCCSNSWSFCSPTIPEIANLTHLNLKFGETIKHGMHNAYPSINVLVPCKQILVKNGCIFV